MREIQVKVSCDRCHQNHDLITEAKSEATVSINALQRNLDLCEACEKEMLYPLVELMNTHGRRLDAIPAGLKKTRRPGKKKLTVAEQGTPQPIQVPEQLGIIVGGYNEDGTITCPCGSVIGGNNPSSNYVIHGGKIHGVEHYSTCPTCQKECASTRSCSMHRVKMHNVDLAMDMMRRVNDLLLTS